MHKHTRAQRFATASVLTVRVIVLPLPGFFQGFFPRLISTFSFYFAETRAVKRINSKVSEFQPLAPGICRAIQRRALTPLDHDPIRTRVIDAATEIGARQVVNFRAWPAPSAAKPSFQSTRGTLRGSQD